MKLFDIKCNLWTVTLNSLQKCRILYEKVFLLFLKIVCVEELFCGIVHISIAARGLFSSN